MLEVVIAGFARFLGFKVKSLYFWLYRHPVEDYRRTEWVTRPGTDPGGRQTVPEDIPPNRAGLKLHSRLRKAEKARTSTGPHRACKVPFAMCLEYGLLSAGVELEKRCPDTWRSSVQKKLDAASTSGRVGE